MKVLIACEFSGIVRDAFTRKGHFAMSCDLLPTETPGNHYQGDVRDLLYLEWDLIIAHPPCTFLSTSGNRWFNISKYGKKAIERYRKQKEAVDFFMMFTNLKCDKVAIENSVGVMTKKWRRWDQIIQPYYFGDKARKATCLWLKGLPKLTHNPTEHVVPEIVHYKNGKGSSSKWHMDTFNLRGEERRKERSRTFLGIARAMADQWGCNA
jgi:hypothetical protein